jgi:hypothetical protein
MGSCGSSVRSPATLERSSALRAKPSPGHERGPPHERYIGHIRWGDTSTLGLYTELAQPCSLGRTQMREICILFVLALSACAEDSENEQHTEDSAVNDSGSPHQDAGVPCGNPEADPGCLPAMDEPTCIAHGGQMRAHEVEPYCICPTRDRGCPCETSSDCEGECWVPDDVDCRSEIPGTCSPFRPQFGVDPCLCEVRGDDGRMYICE